MEQNPYFFDVNLSLSLGDLSEVGEVKKESMLRPSGQVTSPWKEIVVDPMIKKTMMAEFGDFDESIKNMGNS